MLAFGACGRIVTEIKPVRRLVCLGSLLHCVTMTHMLSLQLQAPDVSCAGSQLSLRSLEAFLLVIPRIAARETGSELRRQPTVTLCSPEALLLVIHCIAAHER